MNALTLRALPGCDRFSELHPHSHEFVSFDAVRGFFGSLDLKTARRVASELRRQSRRNEHLTGWLFDLTASISASCAQAVLATLVRCIATNEGDMAEPEIFDGCPWARDFALVECPG
jgi:hypothetical protein